MIAEATRLVVAPRTPAVPRLRRRGVLPGFGLTFGYVATYLGLLVLLPLAALVYRTAALPRGAFWAAVSGPRAWAAFQLSFGASLLAALLNVVCGFFVAWTLARYRFFGRALVDALVDLPLALPTAVAGIALTAIWSESGWIGAKLAAHGIQSAYSPLGVTIALVFVGLPFVVRTVEPILVELDPQIEEAAAVLGASRLRTFFSVIIPTVAPALLTGFSLAFARALGEYGSIVFISGNMPGKTEIVPLLIVTRLEQFDYAGASAMAIVMIVASFAVLFGVNLLQARIRRRREGR
jgi:sulfate transport system permease protein